MQQVNFYAHHSDTAQGVGEWALLLSSFKGCWVSEQRQVIGSSQKE